jgi:hypothetical protein
VLRFSHRSNTRVKQVFESSTAPLPGARHGAFGVAGRTCAASSRPSRVGSLNSLCLALSRPRSSSIASPHFGLSAAELPAADGRAIAANERHPMTRR